MPKRSSKIEFISIFFGTLICILFILLSINYPTSKKVDSIKFRFDTEKMINRLKKVEIEMTVDHNRQMIVNEIESIGSKFGQNEIGEFLLSGYKFMDPVLSRRFRRVLAEYGYSKYKTGYLKFHLAKIHLEGIDTPRNPETALRVIELAANSSYRELTTLKAETLMAISIEKYQYEVFLLLIDASRRGSWRAAMLISSLPKSLN